MMSMSTSGVKSNVASVSEIESMYTFPICGNIILYSYILIVICLDIVIFNAISIEHRGSHGHGRIAVSINSKFVSFHPL